MLDTRDWMTFSFCSQLDLVRGYRRFWFVFAFVSELLHAAQGWDVVTERGAIDETFFPPSDPSHSALWF